ncbi:MAG: hypothetical protein ACD_73C00102G0002 [uncultured bacterium]|nr:MAG: hypothetical protein ACD_73C00102G0002 [uncultured bacterium]
MKTTWTTLQSIKFRIVLSSFGFILYLGVILFRSYQLQIPENDRVDLLTEQQYHAKIAMHPKRGTIYDKNGEVLAMDVQVASIAIHPRQMAKDEALMAKFSEILKMPTEKISEKMNSNKKFEWLARRVPAEQGQQIADLKIAGVDTFTEYRRFYPNKELAGNILGAVGYDAKALGGLELALDTYLKSSPGNRRAERDAKGRFFTPFVETRDIYHDVYLTIDANLQYIAEKYLWENAQKYSPKSGFAIVMDPHTGGILAMANYPRFNPNVYWEYSQDAWKNHAVIDTYEPGSTFKSIMAATALESGKVKSGDSFFCENGSFQIGSHVIHDHGGGYQNLTLADIIKVSSNIGVTKVGRKVGKEAFSDMITGLGFGQKVDLEFPGVERGRVSAAKRWSDIDFSNIAFGQGLSVTGIQMTQAYATFANDGVRMKPLLVSKVMDSDGNIVVENKITELAHVMKPKAAQDLGQILKGVVEEGGTGKAAKLKGYAVSGKTGTAQKVDAVSKKYDNRNYVGSFIGYVPTRNPEYVIYVVYDSPTPSHLGGVVAAPVFKNIASEALAYAGVPPDHFELAKVQKSNETVSFGGEALAD